MMRRSLLAAALVVVAWCARADEAPKRTHDITLDDYFTQVQVAEFAPSPDGGSVAYVTRRWAKKGDGLTRVADLSVVEVATGKSAAVRTALEGCKSVQWSADGKLLYFAAGDAVHSIEARPGGEPHVVTKVEGLGLFRLAPDGKALYYTVNGPQAVEDAWAKLRERHKGPEYAGGTLKVSRVSRLPLGAKDPRPTPVLDEKRFIHDMELSPDGKSLAMITAPDDTVVSFEGRSTVDVADLAAKTVTRVYDKEQRKNDATPYAWLEHLAWSPDGKRLAFNTVFDGHPAEVKVAAPFGGDDRPLLTVRRGPEHIKGYGSPLGWDGEALLFLGEAGAAVRLYGTATPREPGKARTPAGSVVDSFRAGKAGPVLLMNDAERLPDLYHFDTAADKPRRLTHLNPQSATWKLPQISVVTWKAPDGTPVEGILELPPGYKGGAKLPLLVSIHGGPTTAVYNQLQYSIYGRTFLAARGYAVLWPNYRGSTGYGDKFLTDLIGRENDLDVKDILAGVDAMIDRGIADPERLGVLGWSNGGYLTNCVISTTTRFKAASSGACLVDAMMQWGANDEPAYCIALKGGLPWDKAETYVRSSPSYRLDRVKTPTLIHVGAADERCPPMHSRLLYRALHEYNKVPTELVVYPGEPHGLGQAKHLRAKMAWDVAWFDRYVLGKKE